MCELLSLRSQFHQPISLNILVYQHSNTTLEHRYEPEVQQEYMRVEDKVYEVSYNLRRVDSWLRQFLDWCNPDVCQIGPTISRCGSYFGCEVNNSTGLFDSGVQAFTGSLNEWYQFTTVTSSPAFYPIDSTTVPNRDLISYPIEYVEKSVSLSLDYKKSTRK